MARHNQNTVAIFSSDDEMRESESFKDSSLIELVSILPCRLQIAVMAKKPELEENSSFYLFCTDETLIYANFYNDFGPLNLAKLYHYCSFLNKALQQETRATKTLIHYTGKDPKMILNAAFLIGSYSLIYLRFNVQTVMKALGPILKHANGAKFCDASINDLAYLSLKDCLSAVIKAAQRNFFNFDDFNAIDYEYYECVENGDLNWIVPDKILAFCGPNFCTERTNETVMLGPDVYVEYFKENNVTAVVRLNSPRYDTRTFTKAGINHFDLYFSDGSTPSERVTKQFMKICENTPGAVAVHCKAGLGRTGTLIGAFLIKHYQLTAMEAIGWLRISRPGSVIGQQQSWLNSKQVQLLQEGELFRQHRQHHAYNPPEKHARGVYSLQKGKESDDKQTAKKPNLESTTGPANDSENVQRISQRVDTMCLNDEDEQESDCLDVVSQVNNNVVHCKPNRIKKVTKLTSRYIRGNRLNGGRTILTTTTSTTTTFRRGRGNANVPPLGGSQQLQETHVSRKKTVTSRQTVPSRMETTSAPSVRNQRNASVQTASQGDQLVSIKAARRLHVPTDSNQQKIRSMKDIPACPGIIFTSSGVPITPKPNVVVKDKGDSALQKRNDAVKNNNSAEGGTSQSKLPPSLTQTSTFVSDPTRNNAPSSTVVDARKGDSTPQSPDKCAPVTHASVTRAMKKNHPAEGPNSQSMSMEIRSMDDVACPITITSDFVTDIGDNQSKFKDHPTEGPSASFMSLPNAYVKRTISTTKVTTTVKQIKELTYELSLDLNRICRLFLPSTICSTTKIKKCKTHGILVMFKPETPDYLTDIFTFDVKINMADVLSDTADPPVNKNVYNNVNFKSLLSELIDTNPSTKGTLAVKKELNKAPGQQPRSYVKQRIRSMPAELTWSVEEKNRFTIRVSFDLAVMHNLQPVPAYMLYYRPKSDGTVSAASAYVKRQFETVVTGVREDLTGPYVNFLVKLNLKQVLEKPKMQATSSLPPCNSKSVVPVQISEGGLGTGDSASAMILCDHNGNDASTEAQHEKQLMAPTRTVNTNAETDARPYKRLRVDVSRP